MTVRELIRELQELPEEAMDKKVLIFYDGKKPEYQSYDYVMVTTYDHLWDDEENPRFPIIHAD